MRAVARLCPTLCNPMNYSLPGSSVYGLFQARILEWVAVSSSRGIFPTQVLNLHLLKVSCIAGGIFTAEPLGSPYILEERHEQKINEYTKN